MRHSNQSYHLFDSLLKESSTRFWVSAQIEAARTRKSPMSFEELRDLVCCFFGEPL